MNITKFLDNFYKRGYKLHLILPIVLVIFCLAMLPFVPLGVDLKGGTILKIEAQTNYTAEQIKDFIEQKYSLAELSVNKKDSAVGHFIEIEYLIPQNQLDLHSKISAIKATAESNKSRAKSDAIELLKSLGVDISSLDNVDYPKVVEKLDTVYNDYKNVQTNNVLFALKNEFGIDISKTNVREIAPTMGSTFYSSAIKVSLWAILLIVIVIFLFFREFIPSAAVIGAVIIDTLASLAGMAIFGIPLSLITISSILMMVGYSIQTDILLTTKVLKKGESTSPRLRAGEAIVTGLTMTFTTMAALLSMLVIAYYYNVDVILDISAVLLFGMIGDIIATWFMNAPVLVWYVESKDSAKSK